MLETASTTDPITRASGFDPLGCCTMNLQGFAFCKVTASVGINKADFFPRESAVDEHRNTRNPRNPPTIMGQRLNLNPDGILR